MRVHHIIRIISMNAVIIFILVFITLNILDWYNPYMDFIGHAFAYQIGFSIAVPVSILNEIFEKFTKTRFGEGYGNR